MVVAPKVAEGAVRRKEGPERKKGRSGRRKKGAKRDRKKELQRAKQLRKEKRAKEQDTPLRFEHPSCEGSLAPVVFRIPRQIAYLHGAHRPL